MKWNRIANNKPNYGEPVLVAYQIGGRYDTENCRICALIHTTKENEFVWWDYVTNDELAVVVTDQWAKIDMPEV